MTSWKHDDPPQGGLDDWLAERGLRLTQRGDWALVGLALVVLLSFLALVGMVSG